MQTPFLPPDELNLSQLFFVTCIYGYVLYIASGLIGDGSELLQLIPSIAGLVGSIVVPILGAVPDGMMVLFSGLGPDAQQQVAVGVGALAGSTIMLLTLPWFIAVFCGRVPLNKTSGEPDYTKKNQQGVPMMETGVAIQPSEGGGPLVSGAKIMIGTSMIYLIIQVPASLAESKHLSMEGQADYENFYALCALIASTLAFVGYLVAMYLQASSPDEGRPNDERVNDKLLSNLQKGQVSLRATLNAGNLGKAQDMKSLSKVDRERIEKISKTFFHKFDTSGDGQLDKNEFPYLLRELGEPVDPAALDKTFKEVDKNCSGDVSLSEFQDFLVKYMSTENLTIKDPEPAQDTEEDEEAEMPDDLANLTPNQQLVRLIMRSCWMMGLGTALVLVFSDPAVDVLGEWGKRFNISPFYVSFFLAPFASNASELICAQTYASKKTAKSIVTSLQTLEGAACMNNTYCNMIFFGLVYFKQLAWQFTAETICIVGVQVLIGFIVITKRTQTMMDAFIIIACYPGTVVVVQFLEKVVGLD